MPYIYMEILSYDVNIFQKLDIYRNNPFPLKMPHFPVV